jgi:hypothetical protein
MLHHEKYKTQNKLSKKIKQQSQPVGRRRERLTDLMMRLEQLRDVLYFETEQIQLNVIKPTDSSDKSILKLFEVISKSLPLIDVNYKSITVTRTEVNNFIANHDLRLLKLQPNHRSKNAIDPSNKSSNSGKKNTVKKARQSLAAAAAPKPKQQPSPKSVKEKPQKEANPLPAWTGSSFKQNMNWIAHYQTVLAILQSHPFPLSDPQKVEYLLLTIDEDIMSMFKEQEKDGLEAIIRCGLDLFGPLSENDTHFCIEHGWYFFFIRLIPRGQHESMDCTVYRAGNTCDQCGKVHQGECEKGPLPAVESTPVVEEIDEGVQLCGECMRTGVRVAWSEEHLVQMHIQSKSMPEDEFDGTSNPTCVKIPEKAAVDVPKPILFKYCEICLKKGIEERAGFEHNMEYHSTGQQLQAAVATSSEEGASDESSEDSKAIYQDGWKKKRISLPKRPSPPRILQDQRHHQVPSSNENGKNAHQKQTRLDSDDRISSMHNTSFREDRLPAMPLRDGSQKLRDSDDRIPTKPNTSFREDRLPAMTSRPHDEDRGTSRRSDSFRPYNQRPERGRQSYPNPRDSQRKRDSMPTGRPLNRDVDVYAGYMDARTWGVEELREIDRTERRKA